MANCDNCGEIADGLIECPLCIKWCCEDCIAGKGVACFECEDDVS